MDADRSPGAEKAVTTAERVSDLELAVTRMVNGPVRLVFEAWTRPELFQRWWAPSSFGVSVISFEADIRTGGSYKLTMNHAASARSMTFFGRYLEVTPPSRLVWTNEEGGEGGAITTVTFEEQDGATRVVVRELFASTAALEEAVASGSTSGWGEQFDQLDALVRSLGGGG